MQKYNLETNINHRLATVAMLLKREAFRVISEKNLNITPEQWVVLYYLWEEDGLSIGNLVKRSKKDFANISRIVEKLIASGYVEKKRSPEDGRSFHIYLLPKAFLIRNEVQKCWQELSDMLADNMSEQEKSSFLKILDKIEDNLIKSSGE